MSNKLRLSVYVVCGDDYLVTLSADTPYGRMVLPVLITEKGVDVGTAMKRAMAVVERLANRSGRGRKPKYYRHCSWIVGELGSFKKDEEVSLASKPIMPPVISSLLH